MQKTTNLPTVALGRTDMRITRVGFGAWAIGGGGWEFAWGDQDDEQSIEASLSTFSAHLRNLGEILERATDESLVLMDELGAGTDPSEGAALGGAILEELTQRGALTVATTHLGALKQLSTESSAIVNASLQFDAVALAPTYRLIKGIPGRSYGLGIARRLRLPERVLARAEERVPKQERDLAVLLAEIEHREAELTEREREAELDRVNLDARRESVEMRERTMREAERTQEKRARQEARRFLLDARSEIEQTIKSLRQEAANQDETARDARRRPAQLLADRGRTCRQRLRPRAARDWRSACDRTRQAARLVRRAAGAHARRGRRAAPVRARAGAAAWASPKAAGTLQGRRRCGCGQAARR